MNVGWATGSAQALDSEAYGPYRTHEPALAAAIAAARPGPVLELGVGLSSTPLLHALCAAMGRPLVSLEDKLEWVERVAALRSPTHRIGLVPSWNECLDWLWQYGNWAVIFVDHWTESGQERIRSIEALADKCELMVVHDMEWSEYQVPLTAVFKHHVMYKRMTPWTAIASNVRDVSEFARDL